MTPSARPLGILLCAATAVVLVGCSSSIGDPGQSPSPSGTIRHLHFTRLGFATNCQYVQTGTIDGATYDLFGGLPGATRQGPLSATPLSGSSCLRPGLDHSVFASAEMRIEGQRQPPHAAFAYYLALNGVTNVDVFPQGLQMTATRVQFSCAHGGAPRKTAPYDCRPVGSVDPMVDAWVTFPTCWDGSGTAPEDVEYPVGTTCPAGFPRYLPKLQATFSWNAPDGTGATFSTGAFEARWTNGWDQGAIAALVRDCIQHPHPCGAVVNYFHRTPLPPSGP